MQSLRDIRYSVEEVIIHGDLEELDELVFKEVDFAIDLVHRSRVVVAGVVRVVTNLLQGLPCRPGVRLRVRRRCGVWRGIRRGIRCGIRRGIRRRIGCRIWCGVGRGVRCGRTALWAVSFSLSEFITNTSFVVITS